MTKYLLIAILILNQLLAVNSDLLKGHPLVLCICDYGESIALEDKACTCQEKNELNEKSIKSSMTKVNLCIELPVTAGYVATKCFESFDVNYYLKPYIIPNKKAEFSYFFSQLALIKNQNCSIYKADRSIIVKSESSSCSNFNNLPLSNLRC